MSAYDAIARLYDPGRAPSSRTSPFYVEEAVRSGGPVVELGVGTGRIAVPTAAAGIAVVGVDPSAGMLDVAREQAELAGVERRPPPRRPARPAGRGRVPARDHPFRSLLHMETDADRRAALARVRSSCAGRATSSSTSSRRATEDIAETHGRWLEREPGIWERADWDEQRAR